jgi:hypothetical protein
MMCITNPGRLLPHLLFTLCLLLTGCTGLEQRGDIDESVALDRAADDLPEDRLLNVWIEVFEEGPTPTKEEMARGITPEIRKAEARFIPVHLKKTLQQTALWGAVRVLPLGEHPSAELLVRGSVLASDGEQLKLHVTALDSTGRQWLDKEYRQVVEGQAYDRIDRGRFDAFQDVYNAIANDLARQQQSLPSNTLIRIRQVAELSFAAEMAPDVFADYLGKDAVDHRTIRRLPALDDPMLQRVLIIRERDYLFVDTLNGHYDAYYRDLWEPYANWRRFRSEEATSLREIERQAMTRKVLGIGAVVGAIALSMLGGRDLQIRTDSLRNLMIIGGALVAKSGFDKDSEKQIHIDALDELGTSFESEASPMVVEMEGETHRLNGSAESQYAKWRKLLQRIHLTETGLAAVPD